MKKLTLILGVCALAFALSIPVMAADAEKKDDAAKVEAKCACEDGKCECKAEKAEKAKCGCEEGKCECKAEKAEKAKCGCEGECKCEGCKEGKACTCKVEKSEKGGKKEGKEGRRGGGRKAKAEKAD